MHASQYAHSACSAIFTHTHNTHHHLPPHQAYLAKAHGGCRSDDRPVPAQHLSVQVAQTGDGELGERGHVPCLHRPIEAVEEEFPEPRQGCASSGAATRGRAGRQLDRSMRVRLTSAPLAPGLNLAMHVGVTTL
jgi:hypothetical protein